MRATCPAHPIVVLIFVITLAEEYNYGAPTQSLTMNDDDDHSGNEDITIIKKQRVQLLLLTTLTAFQKMINCLRVVVTNVTFS
jgi:hypothetical protein